MNVNITEDEAWALCLISKLGNDIYKIIDEHKSSPNDSHFYSAVQIGLLKAEKRELKQQIKELKKQLSEKE